MATCWGILMSQSFEKSVGCSTTRKRCALPSESIRRNAGRLDNVAFEMVLRNVRSKIHPICPSLLWSLDLCSQALASKILTTLGAEETRSRGYQSDYCFDNGRVYSTTNHAVHPAKSKDFRHYMGQAIWLESRQTASRNNSTRNLGTPLSRESSASS